jgi:NAD+ synthase (glutamine-hydrolysing)
MIMAVSNRTGAIVLTTGNKSELAVGYCTLYGDMNGGLAVLSDVPKTRVFSCRGG